MAESNISSLWMEGSLYLYRRKLGDTAVVVALNAGPSPAQLPPSIAPSHSPILCHAYDKQFMYGIFHTINCHRRVHGISPFEQPPSKAWIQQMCRLKFTLVEYTPIIKNAGPLL